VMVAGMAVVISGRARVTAPAGARTSIREPVAVG
jgi:hypothetical protein